MNHETNILRIGWQLLWPRMLALIGMGIGGYLWLVTFRILIGQCDIGKPICQSGASDPWMWVLCLTGITIFAVNAFRLGMFVKRFRLVWAAVDVERSEKVMGAALKSGDLPLMYAAQLDLEKRKRTLQKMQRPQNAVPSPEIAMAAIATGGNPIEWLNQQTPDVRHFIGTHWNWDYDLSILDAIIRCEDCDGGTAAEIFWLAGASDMFPFGPDMPEYADDFIIQSMIEDIARRFEKQQFATMRFSFDDDQDWRPAALANFNAGKIDWNPSFVPTKSTGRALSIDDFSPIKQAEIKVFLERFGVGV